MSDVETLKQQMLARREKLSDKIGRIKGDLSKEHSSDWSEQAQERENDEVLDQLGGDAEQELHDINLALDRMDSGEYGVCVSCATEIPMARLEIKPEAATCVNCAEAAEA